MSTTYDLAAIERKALSIGLNPAALWELVHAIVALAETPEGKALIVALMSLVSGPTTTPTKESRSDG